jgi:hypothetical protein
MVYRHTRIHPGILVYIPAYSYTSWHTPIHPGILIYIPAYSYTSWHTRIHSGILVYILAYSYTSWHTPIEYYDYGACIPSPPGEMYAQKIVCYVRNRQNYMFVVKSRQY